MSMTDAPIPLSQPLTPEGYIGYLVRNTRTSGFKLAIIVGAQSPDRLRVRFWRANSACWTQPTLVARDYLCALTAEERKTRSKLIARASHAAREFVGRVWS